MEPAIASTSGSGQAGACGESLDPNLTEDESERVRLGRKLMTELKDSRMADKYSGVIEGGETIPAFFNVNKTWLEIFKYLEINFEPETMIFRAYSQNIEDLTVPIYKLYDTYRTNRDIYYGNIIPRRRPRQNPGKKQVNETPRIIPDIPIPATTTTTPIRRKSRHTFTTANLSQKDNPNLTRGPLRKSSSHAGRSSHKINNHSTSSSSLSSSSSFEGGDNKEEEELVLPIPQSSMAPPPQSTTPLENNPEIPFQFKPTSAFVQHEPKNNPTPNLNRGFIEPSQLTCRDESTMAGEDLLQGEEELKPKIMRYFNAHCSNRDMLSMRKELLGLKRNIKYQALNRLIPFTAGILQNAFVDAEIPPGNPS